MTRRPAHDVVVVGAGPAGSTVASLLATRGHDVVMLDREAFPRVKPCGESVNPGAVAILRQLGLLGDVLTLPHRRIDQWSIRPVHGPALEVAFPRGEFGIAVERAGFDQVLLAGAIRSGVTTRVARVADVLVEDGRVAGVRTASGDAIRARFVVGADGLRSVVVRRLGLLGRAPKLRKVALTAHVTAASVPPRTGVLEVNRWGCIGVVTMGDGLANVVVVLNDGRTLKGGRDAWHTFDDLIASSRALRGAVRCSSVRATGPFDWPTRRVWAPGAILVGDAAGYYDPFTGQGIRYALRSGTEAAATIDAALVSPEAANALFDKYDDWHRRDGAAARRLQHAIEFGVARPAIFSAAIFGLRLAPSIASRLIATIGDVPRADRVGRFATPTRARHADRRAVHPAGGQTARLASTTPSGPPVE